MCRRSATSGAASNTCSKLSSSSSVGVPSHASRARLGRSSAVASNTPRASAIAGATNAGFRTAANSTNSTRDAPSAAIGACHLQRQTGLPDSSRPGERDEACGGISQPVPQRLHVGIAAEQGREGQGQRDAAQFIDRGGRERAPARSQGARHGSDRSDQVPRTARARSRRAAAVVPRARARSRHEPTGPQSSRAPPA